MSEIADERVNDPTVMAVREKVRIVTDPTVARHEAYVAILLTDGRRLELHVPHGKGTRQNPLTDEDLAEKLRSLAVPVIGEAGAARVLALIDRLETLDDAGELARATAPSE